jgi:hypothetical protein
MKVPPLKAYKILRRSDLETEDAKRLVQIIKRAPLEEGIAIFKSLAWSIDRALKQRRIKKVNP